jgi:hypothetical protein
MLGMRWVSQVHCMESHDRLLNSSVCALGLRVAPVLHAPVYPRQGELLPSHIIIPNVFLTNRPDCGSSHIRTWRW